MLIHQHYLQYKSSKNRFDVPGVGQKFLPYKKNRKFELFKKTLYFLEKQIIFTSFISKGIANILN